jgi:hypothetical protein
MIKAENEQNLRSRTNREVAIIVAGDSLLKITAQEKLSGKFLGLVQKARIVLACRVSPK